MVNISDIEAKLSQPLDPSRVKTRKGTGRDQVSYIQGWDVIEAFNSIFGFLGWSRETVLMESLHEPKLIIDPEDPQNNKVVAAYKAKVKITVYVGDRTILREGSAAARSFARTASEAEEQAIKSAETDAMKRAAITFGDQFGLCLYDKEQRGVGRDRRPPVQRQIARTSERPMAPIDEGFDAEPARPTNSERALAVAPRQPSHNNGAMRY